MRRRIGVGNEEEETEKRAQAQTQTQKQMHTNGTEPDYCKSLAMADVISRRALGLDLSKVRRQRKTGAESRREGILIDS